MSAPRTCSLITSPKAEELVAHQVAVRVVDLLEVLEIQEDHGDGLAIAVGALHFMSELLANVTMVERCERILIRETAEPLAQPFQMRLGGSLNLYVAVGDSYLSRSYRSPSSFIAAIVRSNAPTVCSMSASECA